MDNVKLEIKTTKWWAYKAARSLKIPELFLLHKKVISQNEKFASAVLYDWEMPFKGHYKSRGEKAWLNCPFSTSQTCNTIKAFGITYNHDHAIS